MTKAIISRLVRIVTGGGGDGDVPLLETGVSRLERFVHFWVLVGRSFVRNRCPVRASALSYSTLLALIPLLAVAIGVTSSLLKQQGEEKIYQAIDKFVSNIMPPATLNTNGEAVSLDLGPSMSVALTRTNSAAGTNAPAAANNPDKDRQVVAVQKEVARNIQEFVKNTQGTALGVTGMLLLVLVAIRMLANIEMTFNDIWGVTRGRSWFARVIQYWTVITLGPLLLICALGLAGSPHLQATKNLVSDMPVIGGFVFQLLPLVVLWLAFALFYLLVPNTKVQFNAAFVGGVVAGSLWHLNNVFGFLYVSRVVTNSKIYGSLGLIPVFMAGLYFSWFILLFGAQVAYAFQNRAAYLQDKLADNVNQRGREFVALRLMTNLGQRFQRGLPPATMAQISAELGLPSRLVQQVLRTLLAAGLVLEIHGAETGYSPARPLDSITAQHILLAMRTVLGQDMITQDEPVRAEVFGEFARIQQAEEAAASAVTLQALVNRVQARLELAPPGDGKNSPPA
jgi:membrane protein